MYPGRADRGAGRHARKRALPATRAARPLTLLRVRLSAARTRARFAVFVVVFVFANLAGMSAAFGDGEGDSGGSSVWRWMDVHDSGGRSAWGYSMSLDYGGLTDVGNAVFGGVTGLCWFFYQWFVIASIWLINFALGMEWFDPLREPAANIADGLEGLLQHAGVVPVLLTITAVAAGMLIMRGAWATAVFEVIVALIVLALGTGVFANPVDQTVGTTGSSDRIVDSADNSGWLAQATGAGLELAGGLQQEYGQSDGPPTDFTEASVVREKIEGQLVDTFLRTPHQLINYGKPLDDTECEGAYNRALNTTPPPQPSYVTGDAAAGDRVTIDSDGVPEEGDPGWADWVEYRDWLTLGDAERAENLQRQVDSNDSWPYTPNDELDKEPREIVGDCDEAAGKRAENPSPGMAGDAATMGFGVMFLVGLAALLAFTLIFLGVEFLWCALRSIWDFVIGLLPGRSRHTLWQTLSTAVWCLIGVAFTSIFLVTYLLVLNAVAESFGGGGNIMGAFALVDILMLVGLLLFWRLRQRMKSAAARTAALLAKRPNPKGRPPGGAGQPTKMPTGSSGAAMPGGLAASGKQGIRAGKATAAGVAAAAPRGAAGVAKSARVGGALASGGLLMGVGVPFAIGRKTNPWKRDREKFAGAQAQFQTAAGASVPTGGRQEEAAARPHGSREAFSDARGLHPKYRSPAYAAVVGRLNHAQPTMEEAMTTPGPDGEKPFDKEVARNGVVTFAPRGSNTSTPSRSAPGAAAATGTAASKTGRGAQQPKRARVQSWFVKKSVKHGPRVVTWGGAVGTAYTSPSPNIVAAIATAGFAADVASDRIRQQWEKKR